MADWKENKKEPSKKEFIFLGLIIACLVLGGILKNTAFSQGVPICWIGAGVCVILWMLSVRKEKKKEDHRG